MNGEEIHGATVSACSQNKNHKHRNEGEGAELVEESLCSASVTPRGIKTGLEGVVASLCIGFPTFKPLFTQLTLETVKKKSPVAKTNEIIPWGDHVLLGKSS